jgi:hypothetical protein
LCPEKDDPNNPATDIHNPDPKLRGRSTVGIVIIWKLAYKDGEYSGGYVYNPRDGKTYRIAAEIIDDSTVKIHAYRLIPRTRRKAVSSALRLRVPAPVLAVFGRAVVMDGVAPRGAVT